MRGRVCLGPRLCVYVFVCEQTYCAPGRVKCARTTLHQSAHGLGVSVHCVSTRLCSCERWDGVIQLEMYYTHSPRTFKHLTHTHTHVNVQIYCIVVDVGCEARIKPSAAKVQDRDDANDVVFTTLLSRPRRVVVFRLEDVPICWE